MLPIENKLVDQKYIGRKNCYSTQSIQNKMIEETNEQHIVGQKIFVDELFKRVFRLTARKPMWYERCS